MSARERLPVEATDDGDRIVVAPDRATRGWAIGGAVLGLTVGVLLLVTGEGPVLVVAGVAAAIAGVYLLLVQSQRLEFDADEVRRRSLLRPATVPWSQVAEATISRRYVRSPVVGSARRLGGLTLSMGAGGRRGRGVRRDTPITVLGVERADGADLQIELNGSDPEQGEALLAVLKDRGWLPDDVKVTNDAER